MNAKDESGNGIAIYAAASDKQAGLEWIKQHAPDLLWQKNNIQKTIGHYAVCSGCYESLQ